MDNYHLVHKDDEWKLKEEYGKRALKTFDNKSDAVKESTRYVKENGGSLKIHKQDNTIQEERTYLKSKDPKKSKG